MKKFKRTAAAGLALVMMTCATGCSSDGGNQGDFAKSADAKEDSSSNGKNGTINVYAFTDEVPKMIDKFAETHPDFGYDINATIIATTDGAY